LKPFFQFDFKGISLKTQQSLYFNMLKSRLIEEKMLILLRQGKISKWFSGIGQEAISVGVTMALNSDEYILPMHRNLGVLPHEKFLYTVCFVNGKGRPMDLQKVETVRFTLELKIIKSLE
jgi:2-oxoisovalerate dehydrogenase E1 component